MTRIDKKVSVIVPVFNTAIHLPICIESILAQSHRNIEIILIDDNSNDGSTGVGEDYASKHNNIIFRRLLTKRGPGGARNVGLRLSSGEYIGFVDSDDWIDTNMYHFLLQSIEASCADIAICGVIHEKERPSKTTRKYWFSCPSVLENTLAFEVFTKNIALDSRISTPVWNKLYSASFIAKNKLHFLENSLCEDDYFNFFAFLQASRVATDPRCYYHYRQRPGSLSSDITPKHIDDLFHAFRKIRNELEASDSFDNYRECYLSFFMHDFLFVLNLLQRSMLPNIKKAQLINRMVMKSKGVVSLHEFLGRVDLSRVCDILNPTEY